MSEWARYSRTNVAEMRPLNEDEKGASKNLMNISVSAPDAALALDNPDEFDRGFVARNPQNHTD